MKLSAYDAGTAADGLNFFAAPYAATRSGDYNGSATVATLNVRARSCVRTCVARARVRVRVRESEWQCVLSERQGAV